MKPVTLTIAQIEACLANEIDPVDYAERLTRDRDEIAKLTEERATAQRELTRAKFAAETAALVARREKIATAEAQAAAKAEAAKAEADMLARAKASGQRGAASLRRHVLARAMEKAGIR